MTDNPRCSSSSITLNTLPRELRDEIYSYLWDENTIRNIRTSLNPGPHCFPSSYEDFDLFPGSFGKVHDRRRPWFLIPRYLGHEITAEIVQSFYRHYPGLEVNDVRTINAMMKHDFFGVDTRLCDHTIPAFTVCVHLDPPAANYLSEAELKAHLPKLIASLPNLTPGFVLTVRLRSNYSVGLFGCSCPSHFECPIRHGNVAVLATVTDALKGIKEFVYDFELERKRKVVLRLEMGRYDDTIKKMVLAVVPLQLDDINNTEETWRAKMMEVVKYVMKQLHEGR